jgi:hypothetical protein
MSKGSKQTYLARDIEGNLSKRTYLASNCLKSLFSISRALDDLCTVQHFSFRI